MRFKRIFTDRSLKEGESCVEDTVQPQCGPGAAQHQLRIQQLSLSYRISQFRCQEGLYAQTDPFKERTFDAL